jgi:hypothetical protein
MQKYIDQLLEDMAAAQRPEEDSFPVNEPFSIEQHFEEVEKWLKGEEPEHDFSYYCGLKAEQFPPVNQLTNKQLKTLFKAFGQLLFSWNLGADIPKSVPLRQAYPLLISILNRNVEIVNHGAVTIEFCTTDPPLCPFGEHCTCRQYFEELDDQDADNPNNELPF